MNLNELVYRLENSMGIDYDLLSQAANKLRQQQTMIDEYIKATDYWMKLCQEANANYTPQIKELSDEELNKAFDYYCETDEGVLRFNYELRDKWKKEQLIRWKEAFKKASEK
jgi:hypothetical protein